MLKKKVEEGRKYFGGGRGPFCVMAKEQAVVTRDTERSRSPGEEQEPAERAADAASRGAGNIASALLFLRCHKTALSLKKKKITD